LARPHLEQIAGLARPRFEQIAEQIAGLARWPAAALERSSGPAKRGREVLQENRASQATVEQQALSLAKKLSALPEPAMRQAAVVSYLRAIEVEQAVAVLDVLQERGSAGGPPYTVALTALVSALSDEDLVYDELVALYGAAKRQERHSLAQLFFSARPAETKHRKRDEQRELTLGHRKQLARTGDRDRIARVLASPEATVVKELLRNRKVIEQDVIALASRRPTEAAIQREIFASTSWIARYEVKRALVLNPYTPTDIAIRLLVFLRRKDLKLITQTSTLDTVLQQAARQRLERGASS
jgi:hypothetical protein